MSAMQRDANKVINVVAGLIWQNDKLLVCQRRADGAFPLKWEFPGGKIEEGETDLIALKREFQEELAIDVREALLVYQQQHHYVDGPTVSLRFYSVNDWHGEMQNLVFERVSWVNLGDLDHMDFLEGDRPFIQKLMSDGPSAFLRSKS
jgi:8-oxo-dGTP diphosphatase